MDEKRTTTKKDDYCFKIFFDENNNIMRETKQKLNFMQLCVVSHLLEKEIERIKKFVKNSKFDAEIKGD